MKEQIYTIPINDAFDTECECPLCVIEKRLEAEAIEYELGPAMMEPDHRELSNKTGYCRRHLEMMFDMPNKLPLALVLDTHFEELIKGLEKITPEKKGLFKKTDEENILKKDSCMVCDKISKTMVRYAGVLCEMWRDSPEFRKKLASSKGFCLPHFELLYRTAKSVEFKKELLEKEKAELRRISEEIHRFTLKFDYRNRDMEWGTAKDAPCRTVEKTVGYISRREDI